MTIESFAGPFRINTSLVFHLSCPLRMKLYFLPEDCFLSVPSTFVFLPVCAFDLSVFSGIFFLSTSPSGPRSSGPHPGLGPSGRLVRQSGHREGTCWLFKYVLWKHVKVFITDSFKKGEDRTY